jgi:hypothetical protein
VSNIVKIALGTFACKGIEVYLGTDPRSGVRAALVDYARRIESGSPPMAAPCFPASPVEASKATSVDLPLDARTTALLEREAARQGVTMDEIAAHAVMLYLAELDRLTPPGRAAA